MLLNKQDLSIIHWVKFLVEGWKKKTKKREDHLKRLGNIEDENEEQLKAIENQGNQQFPSIKKLEADSK